MVVGTNIDKVCMVMDFGGMDLKVGATAVSNSAATEILVLLFCEAVAMAAVLLLSSLVLI